MTLTQPRLPISLGRILITSAAEEALDRPDIDAALGRHVRGDWGDLCPDDCRQNELALREGERLCSAYTDRRATRFYIITKADRSATMVLLPEDYCARELTAPRSA
jgi:hypothetical protein